jgi:hypothetical protein
MFFYSVSTYYGNDDDDDWDQGDEGRARDASRALG